VPLSLYTDQAPNVTTWPLFHTVELAEALNLRGCWPRHAAICCQRGTATFDVCVPGVAVPLQIVCRPPPLGVGPDEPWLHNLMTTQC
jgi:hypothetical protein